MPDTIPPIIWLRAVLGFTAVPIAHRYRLEVNFESLPVNRPKCLIHTYNRDGFMRFDENGGEGPNYEPNSFDGLVEDPRHYNVQRVFDVYANTQNRDLGGVAQQVQKIVDQMKPHLPRGTTLAIRGQVQSMNVSYFGVGVGIAFAVSPSANLSPGRLKSGCSKGVRFRKLYSVHERGVLL